MQWLFIILCNLIFSANGLFHFDEFQIFGRAQLAIEPYTASRPELFFRDMIGDRTGAIHVGPNQVGKKIHQ